MLNNYLLCEDKKESSKQTDSGFEVKDDLLKFVTLKVISSNEEDVPVGSEVKVSRNAGEQDERGIIIRRTDIIYIL